jgi:hypothetical protein
VKSEQVHDNSLARDHEGLVAARRLWRPVEAVYTGHFETLVRHRRVEFRKNMSPIGDAVGQEIRAECREKTGDW